MAKNRSFEGFSPNVIDFFADLEKNNNKEWFDENRPFYEKEIRDTGKALISDMALIFANEGLPYVADPKKALFRINRDIRFSNNKEPYKTNLGMFFPYSLNQASTKKSSAVGLYFHIDHKQTFIAGGVPGVDSEKLKMIREKIAENYDELNVLSADPEIKKYFPKVIELSTPLKTVPRGYDKDHPAADWLKMKDYGYYGDIEQNVIFSAELKDTLLHRAKIMVPFLEYFRTAVE